MESYLLKASLSLIILYGLYRIMLRYEFNHQLNRFIGLTCVFFSTCFPFVRWKGLSAVDGFSDSFHVVATGTADFRDTVSVAVSDNTINAFLIVYAIGASVFMFRSAVGLATLLKIYLNSPKAYRSGFTVVTLSRNLSPFSFFNILFVGTNSIESSEMETMLLHERVHRDQYHSIDAVLLEVLTVMFWFNPAIWFFRRDIKAAHEYFADSRVLEYGINPIDYQLTLFKARTGASIGLGNYLSNKRNLMKRFNMMTKTKTKSNASYWRVSLFFSLMCAILFLGAFSGRNGQAQIDKIAMYEQGEEAMYQTVSRRITYPAGARSENRSGSVRVCFTVTESGNVANVEAKTGTEGYLLNEIVVVGWSKSSEDAKGVNDALRTAAVQAVEGLGKFIPAQKEGKPVSSVLILPIKFTLN
ncbi:MAG TPA: M56 family metallopeptidase [Chryseosolibacter sp.]